MYAGGAAHDSLSPAEDATSGGHNSKFMPESDQFVANLLRDEGFDIHITSVEGDFGEASGFEGFLDIQAKVCDVGDKLGVCLRLIEPAHDPKPDMHSVLLHESRNDRV